MSITTYSIRYPFIITKEDYDCWVARPLWPYDEQHIAMTHGETLLEALKMAGDLADFVLEEMTEEEKECWRACYDPDLKDIYLVFPRLYCSWCDVFDGCPHDHDEYIIDDEEDDE